MQSKVPSPVRDSLSPPLELSAAGAASGPNHQPQSSLPALWKTDEQPRQLRRDASDLQIVNQQVGLGNRRNWTPRPGN
jgi:hypothetical protein